MLKSWGEDRALTELSSVRAEWRAEESSRGSEDPTNRRGLQKIFDRLLPSSSSQSAATLVL